METSNSTSSTNPIDKRAAKRRKLLVGGAVAVLILLLISLGLLFGPRVCRMHESHAGLQVASVQVLPAPIFDSTTLKTALQNRASARVFSPRPLDLQTLSNLLWAADGVNRPATGGRTAPSAYDWRYVDLYLADAQGISRYDATRHVLERLSQKDIRHLTGEQSFVDTAPLTIVLVSDEGKMDKKEPPEMRSIFSGVGAGTIAQNIYLYCASAGLHVVVRASIDRAPLHEALGLGPSEKIIVGQTIGYAPDSVARIDSGATR